MTFRFRKLSQVTFRVTVRQIVTVCQFLTCLFFEIYHGEKSHKVQLKKERPVEAVFVTVNFFPLFVTKVSYFVLPEKLTFSTFWEIWISEGKFCFSLTSAVEIFSEGKNNISRGKFVWKKITRAQFFHHVLQG